VGMRRSFSLKCGMQSLLCERGEQKRLDVMFFLECGTQKSYIERMSD
jgi:hypothetical protein